MTRYFASKDKNKLIAWNFNGSIEEFEEVDIQSENIEPDVNSRGATDFTFEELPRGRKGKKGKKIRCCKKCGKPGHRSDGCPNRKKAVGIDPLDDIVDPEETNKDEEDLVVEIRNLWVVDGENANVVANKLGITLSKFNALVQKHGLHR